MSCASSRRVGDRGMKVERKCKRKKKLAQRAHGSSSLRRTIAGEASKEYHVGLEMS